jgi:prevent-host-death family protein
MKGMKFVTARDFRSRPSQVWRSLQRQTQMIVTVNGKPVALLTSLSENNLEETLRTIRRARAISAVLSVQEKSVRDGNNALTLEDINREISAVRLNRKYS